VGTPTGNKDDEMLKDWLSVLLPLPIAQQSGITADPIGELHKLLLTTLDQSLANPLLQASPRGAKAVQQELKRRLTAPFVDAAKKLGED
jgi:hypothetical protein